MHQIRDWLFISSFPEASSKKTIKKHGIDVMLQLFEPFKMEDVESLYLDTMDGYPIAPANLREGVDFIHKHHARGKKVLVTCGAGISRSVTYSIAALKELDNITLEEAYRQIREAHPEALPDQVHWKSLAEYYQEDTPFWKIWQQVLMDEDDEDDLL